MLSPLHLKKHETPRPYNQPKRLLFFLPARLVPFLLHLLDLVGNSYRRVTNKTTATAMMTTPRKLANPIVQYLAHRISACQPIGTLGSVPVFR